MKPIETARRTFDAEIEGLRAIRDSLDDRFEQAVEMLRAALPECRALGIRRVLISCVRGNEGSRRTILKNGGVYESTVYEPVKGVWLERYWIELD